MQRRFVTLDVFTDQRFAGNPLAVVLDAEGLDKPAMQTIAREFNLSETVFVLPAEKPSHHAKIRIFTPVSELPFAGHPTVGSAVLMGIQGGAAGTQDIVLELGIGPVQCRVTAGDAAGGHASFTLPRLPADLGAASNARTIAAALGLEPEEIGFGDVRPARWSAGAPYSIVPVRGLESVRRCQPDLARWDDAFGFDNHCAAFVFCDEAEASGADFHARMFAPRQGVPEDPATGSAVAAFAGFIPRFRALADGEHAMAIEQGYEMGRPSKIELTLSVRGGALAAASIAGHAVMVSEGKIAD